MTDIEIEAQIDMFLQPVLRYGSRKAKATVCMFLAQTILGDEELKTNQKAAIEAIEADAKQETGT